MENKLPEGWKWKKLGEIAEINPKFDRKSISENIEVTFLPMKCIEELTGNVDTSNIKNIEEVSKGYTPLVENDLLYAKITPCMENGKIAIAKGLKNNLGFASTEFHVIRFKKSACSKFFFFYLIQKRIREYAAINMTGSAGQKRVPATFLKDLLIPLPPLETQKKIVSILEKAEETKKLRAQADELTQKLLQSVFLEMFGDPIADPRGWLTIELEDICVKITDGEHATPKRTESGIYLLSARNIQNHMFSLDDVDFIDKEEYDRISKRIIPQKGDILVSCSGTIGRVTQVKECFKFQLVRSVALLRPETNKVNPTYLEYNFDSIYLKKQIEKSVNQSSQANLFQGKIRKLKIPFPPLELQNKFAEIAEQVEKTKKSQKQSSVEINILFDALMQKAFIGELVS